MTDGQPDRSPFVVACVQMTSGRSLPANLERTGDQVRAAASRGAHMVFLPENAVLMEKDRDTLRAAACGEARHPAVEFFQELVRETGVWLHAGSLAMLPEPGPGPDPDSRLRNRSLVLDPNGTVRARYDKIHLFDVSLPGGETYRESRTFAPGDTAVTLKTPFCTLGLSICYDVRFPGLYRALARAGADVLAVPAAFTRTTGKAHWHVLLRARAIETGAWVVAAAQCGTHEDGRHTWGHSLIVSPWGEIVADGGEEEGLILATIDPAASCEARSRIPSLGHDRDFTIERL